MAACHWAFGRIDTAEFEARALYGLYVALLGVATDKSRPKILDELAALEPKLRATAQQKTRMQA